MSAVQAHQSSTAVAGHWRITASANARSSTEVTYVRGVQTTINSWDLEDPFGPKQFTVGFPAVTIFDRLGEGDLDFLRREANIEIVWTGQVPAGYPFGSFVVEGYMESFDYTDQGLSVTCKGAMYQLDNYQAKPEYLAQPLPYEIAMTRQFLRRPDLRMARPSIQFPAGWTTKFTHPPLGTAKYLIPTGVTNGTNWTGLVTRSTGSWEPVLTSYFQTLLSSMYTPLGRWTWDLAPGRQPILLHRPFLAAVATGCIYVDPVTPGFSQSLTVDYSQSLNVLYGQGSALTGEGYSGQIPTVDGQRTDYLPLAALRQVYPIENTDSWLDPDVMRREVLLQLQPGLTEEQAYDVGGAHLQHFSDPGVTGTITLTTDPFFVTAGGDVVINRMIIKPGMSIQVGKLFGNPQGVMFHIAGVSADHVNGSVTLSVDSKYRDALTVAEVGLRGRDSMNIQRSLIGGNYAPPIPDQLVPWNYSEGSGYIPSSQHFSSVPLFDDMPNDTQFPWTDWTTQRPPSDPSYTHCYIHLGPKSANANNNWSITSDRAGGAGYAYPIKVSQAGTIRLIEIAAYDSSGNLFPVPFHVSFWYARGASVDSTPMIGAGDKSSAAGYPPGQHYPFFRNAWEQYNLDGTTINSPQQTAKPGAQLIRAYGTGWVKAGYWPGSSALGDPPTGMLSDETPMEFNCATEASAIDVYHSRQAGQFPGYIFMLIYCDGQGTNDIYFAGRMYREEPGSVTG